MENVSIKAILYKSVALAGAKFFHLDLLAYERSPQKFLHDVSDILQCNLLERFLVCSSDSAWDAARKPLAPVSAQFKCKSCSWNLSY